MAKTLTVEDVRLEYIRLIGECDLYGAVGREAENTCTYISGLQAMANAIVTLLAEKGDSRIPIPQSK